MTRAIQLPNGRAVTLRAYVAAWRALRLMHPKARLTGWSHFTATAADILRAMSYGVHDRINRHLTHYGRGRKWSESWQNHARHCANAVNSRVIVRPSTVPAEFRGRLAARLWDEAAA